MAWCPKCNNEYRKGIKVCAECGCELVEKEDEKKKAGIIVGTLEQVNELKRFLEYNNLEEVTLTAEEKEGMFRLCVNEKDKTKAQKIARVFIEQKMQESIKSRAAEAKEAEEDDEEDDEESALRSVIHAGGSYMNSAQKAEDNRSSAWMLMLLGGIGLIVVVLGIIDVIPLQIGNPYLFYGVLSAVFLLFIVMGVVSMKSAKIFAKDAESENTLKKNLLEWCQENLKSAEVDERVQKMNPQEEKISDLTEEVLYLKRYEVIIAMINHQFMNLDQSFVERLVDEEIYDMVFSVENV